VTAAVNGPGNAEGRRRARLVLGLRIAGGVLIFAGVLFVLEVANGPGTGPKRFAERRSYDQVKVDLHRSFPLGFSIALAGLGLFLVGQRIAAGASGAIGDDDARTVDPDA